MALLSNPTSGTGEIIPIIKYDARAGRFFRIDRVDGVNHPVDISMNFKAVFDFENVEVGYINFTTGGAPDFHMVPFGTPMPPCPSTSHKQGFRILIKLSKDCGGDVREFAATSGAAVRGLNALHDLYEAHKGSYPGMLPVVICAGITAVATQGGGQKSTNYDPTFTIVQFAPRPADLKAMPRGIVAQSPQALPPPTQAAPIYGGQAQPVAQQTLPFQPTQQPVYVQQQPMQGGQVFAQPPIAGNQRVGPPGGGVQPAPAAGGDEFGGAPMQQQTPQLVSVAPPQQLQNGAVAEDFG